jgi:hypothetical protein
LLKELKEDQQEREQGFGSHSDHFDVFYRFADSNCDVSQINFDQNKKTAQIGLVSNCTSKMGRRHQIEEFVT